MHAQCHLLSQLALQGSSVQNSEAMREIGRLQFASDVKKAQQPVGMTVC